MAKIVYTQSEVNQLFQEEVIVVDDKTRRVTHADILQKTGLPSNFDIEVVPDEEPQPKEFEPDPVL